jgi:pimeloyl-ACP methyl ester carboxylesterase
MPIVLLLLISPLALAAGPKMVPIDGREIAIYCDGNAASGPAVILIPAGGRTAKDWEPVQPAVAAFARVCSYDHAGHGSSGKAAVPLQSVDQHVDDLFAWLSASGETGPFVLVTHSNSGFYGRGFAERHPSETAGLVLVDSSHEEQALRLHQLDPEGPAPDPVTERIGFFIQPGRRLEWRTDKPLIVIGRGQPALRLARDGSMSQTNRMTVEQFRAWDRIWSEFQRDLASRSPRGEYRHAALSGHWIQRDQPQIVIEAIRDLVSGRLPPRDFCYTKGSVPTEPRERVCSGEDVDQDAETHISTEQS